MSSINSISCMTGAATASATAAATAAAGVRMTRPNTTGRRMQKDSGNGDVGDDFCS